MYYVYYPAYVQNYCHRCHPQPFTQIRQYPPTDPSILTESVKEYQVLMNQGELLLKRLSDTTFATELMEAAQKNNQSEVDRLIHSIDGLYVPIQITYTPSGAIFNLQSPAVKQGANCCTLDMTLKWGR